MRQCVRILPPVSHSMVTLCPSGTSKVTTSDSEETSLVGSAKEQLGDRKAKRRRNTDLPDMVK